MNDQTPIEPGGDLIVSLPAGDALTASFRVTGQIDAMLDQIEKATRSQKCDIGTKAGREATKSLAYKVARSKTTLDDAGKLAKEAAQKEVDAVDAQRRKVRERLDALRDEVRDPLTIWEIADEQRIGRLKARLRLFDPERTNSMATPEAIRHVLAEVDAEPLGEDWAEYLDQAEAARAAAEEEAKRQADAERRANVRDAMSHALDLILHDVDAAVTVADAILAGQIPHVRVVL